ncbi:MAG TPA: hypothetical protein VM575_08885 [Nocardioides sp.]|nr:hypothetical protein [Nocardioides sp.]
MAAGKRAGKRSRTTWRVRAPRASAATTGVAGRRRADPGRGLAAPRRRLVALALVAAAIALFAGARSVRLAEAWVQTRLLELGGIDAQQIGTAVLVDVQGRLAGISLAAGCSIGPLLAVMLLCCAPFVWFRSMSVTRVAMSVAQLAAVLVLANEIRIAAIILSMREWGFARGYDFSHVFLGSAITTVGFVLGAVLFVRLFVSRPEATPR